MFRALLSILFLLLVGCAQSMKQTGAATTTAPVTPIDPSTTGPMTETRAAEIAIAAARAHGWKGPFDTFVTRSDERGVSHWATVRLLDHDKNNRLLIVDISTTGEVLDFSVRPE